MFVGKAGNFHYPQDAKRFGTIERLAGWIRNTLLIVQY
jgi:hypothetical protein